MRLSLKRRDLMTDRKQWLGTIMRRDRNLMTFSSDHDPKTERRLRCFFDQNSGKVNNMVTGMQRCMLDI